VAVAAVLALAVLGGGSRSPLFLILPMVPLMSALVGPGDILMPALQGLVAVGGGAAALRLEARPWNEVAVWAGTAAAATAFALGSARRARRRQEAHVEALEARAHAQERLAEAERRRGEAERWVAAGHLADQVAHDVNSPLASLRSNLRYVKEELDGADPEVLQALADGEAAIEEIRAAVSSLRVRSLPPGRRGAG
jgi:signal transduction histidine kinase